MAERILRLRRGLHFFRFRWLILIIGVPGFLLWLGWPVVTYEGYAPTYIAVSDEAEREFLGVVKVQKFANPWDAAGYIKDETVPVFRKLKFPNKKITGSWAQQKAASTLPGDLYFRRENLVWTISPSDKLNAGKRGEESWFIAIEKLAVETDLIFTSGTLKSSQIKARKVMSVRLFFEEPFHKIEKKLKVIF